MSPASSLRQYSYYASWFLRSKLGIKRPLVNTMIIHYGCNLRCQHCSIAANGDKLPEGSSITFTAASREMRAEYHRGAKILFFEGGEPTIWRDGDKGLGDLIAEGRRIGYYVIGYTTNGTGRIFEESDVLSISLDGPRKVHDSIRGAGVYDKLMTNLEMTDHPNIFANMVVMRPNLDKVKETAEVVKANPHIRGLMLNFLTPPPYDIALSYEEKEQVVSDALQWRKEKLPILNTERALKEMLIEDYSAKCPYWVSSFTMPDGSKHSGCPMQGTESCRQCGFDAVREYRLILAGNVETITKMSRRFALSKR
ncbi:MAG: radical SAM protein [Methanomassiliicoccus sp.]|nr:radical SAM protein [Methanomassiliicoccus sp.]